MPHRVGQDVDAHRIGRPILAAQSRLGDTAGASLTQAIKRVSLQLDLALCANRSETIPCHIRASSSLQLFDKILASGMQRIETAIENSKR